MRIRWLFAGLVACAAPRRAGVPEPAHEDPVACRAAVSAAHRTLEGGDPEASVKQLEEAYPRCGDGYGIWAEIAHARAFEDAYEDAAAACAKEISAPRPTVDAFVTLQRIWDRLPPATRARISSLGRTAASPVHVPAIRLEYAWIASFGCPEGHARLEWQAVRDGLDLIRYTCEDGTERGTYFEAAEARK